MSFQLSTDNPIDTGLAHRLSRRTLLGGAVAIGAGFVLAACGKDKSPSTTLVTDTSSAAKAPIDTKAASVVDTTAPTIAAPDTTVAATAAAPTGDAAIAKLAAGLEVLAVGTYSAALDAAKAGKLGEVPPAVAEFVTTAMGHHQKHLDAWNGVLTKAGAAAVTEPDAKLKPTVDTAFAGVKDVAGVAKLALLLEETAAATYLAASPKLVDKDAVKLAGSIQVIDAQHAAILHYVLGDYPVPDVFAKTDLAAS